MSNNIFLSLGSNLGDREGNLVKAAEMIAHLEGFEAVAFSPVYLSAAVEMAQPAPDFLNMVIKGDYIYSPLELLNNLERLEKKLGRTGKGNYQPRSIDIDLLLFGKEIIETERLSVPHRKMTERTFILAPLLQIEPDLIHPVTGKKMASYLDEEEKNQLIMYKESLTLHV
ncbi:MAG: 2-amino-4-hydroxy-6-hydroxymethyldihydropteridine diphosphokinase [candidate division Zixibacteria bacterium]|jgi:2-amino-4-hydroxy-6-hydroxymethyldihydropteridine diphosphokinase|nr:2-amino-4-hydroxy-6-hydroxymethyldihydropteridine diphosphokinase [candidate division Zixibacteria bacterium]